jgi:hypothetical protein
MALQRFVEASRVKRWAKRLDNESSWPAGIYHVRHLVGMHVLGGLHEALSLWR